VDGDPVKGEPSAIDISTTTYAEAFAKLCPRYMAMGMTYTEFWHSNTSVHYAYRKAYELRQAQTNWSLWMQGMYNFNALLCAAPVIRMTMGKGRVEPGKYPDEPYPLTAKEAREREERRERENYERYIARMNAMSEREMQRRKAAEMEKSASEEATEHG